ncbi:N-6 DNA methylase [Enterobacter roggenkampii]|nr:N-6 DNA methylase [Enterobacter cloacae complex sp. 2021EL-01169]MCC3241891.1 N-6 DNA methylase [Enterobacter cloacae complex sp. 2021EL-01169]
MNPHSTQKKRELGAYYTPPELSKVLADWGITCASQTILEPSFGGCGFLTSCIERLEYLGNTKPLNNLYGVDIDQHAFDTLYTKFPFYKKKKNSFILADFISVKPSDFNIKEFDVIIGNPPYVSMHNMTDLQRQSCSDILNNSSFSGKTIGRNASLWSFFLLHSLSFLKNGGRVAWVLPSSLLHADYARKLLDILCGHFKHIYIIKLAERFFVEEGAQETSVILTASDFNKCGEIKGDLTVSSVNNVYDLERELNKKNSKNIKNIDEFKFELISEDIKDAYLSNIKSPYSFRFGDLCLIKIGLVSGANSFFILNKDTIDKYSIPSKVLYPIVARFSFLNGVRHNQAKHKKIFEKNDRSYLLSPNEEQLSSYESVQKYISSLSSYEINKNKTFQKRPNWFEPNHGIDSIIPDAFLSYMIHRGPRLVINQSKINCTNSVHKVFFRDKKMSHKNKIAISISLLSSYSQFSAEIVGRAYSSGVLKIEPTAGKSINVLIDEKIIEPLYTLTNKIEELLDKEEHKEIRKLVDNVLIANGMMKESDCEKFSLGIDQLRSERYKGVKKYHE